VKRKQEVAEEERSKRNRYRQLTDEEKARILQNTGNAKRNKYKQMTVDKVRMLQKKRHDKLDRR
jgi:hypothetical protein